MLHPCFISYVHPENAWAKAAIDMAVAALRSALEIDFGRDRPPFIDIDRLNPGDNHARQLAQAICNSACMVILYHPAYGNSAYCQRELAAMRQIEETRRRIVGGKLDAHRLFIPLVLRGRAEDLPTFVHQDCVWLDYSRQLLTSRDLSGTRPVRERFFQVVDTISAICRVLDHHEGLRSIDCGQFQLPAGGLGSAAAPSQPFPGRG